MEFLREILGEELFNQVSTAINAWNGNEANKEKQVKLANLSGGEYVGKGKHDALQALFDGQKTELEQANNLIADLKKNNKGNEQLQGQITAYEAENAKLKEELAETKLKSAIKVEFLNAKAADVDYLTYKLQESLKEKGEKLELDENDNIKGWDDILNGLKTQFPKMFETVGDDGDYKPVDGKGLPKDFSGGSITKEQFMKMTVDERIALKQKDEKLYKSLRG